MAYPTAVNNQITDAITQTNVKVVAEAPAIAIPGLYQFGAASTGLASQHEGFAQSQTSLAPPMVTGALYQIDAATGEIKAVGAAMLSPTMRKLLGLSEEP